MVGDADRREAPCPPRVVCMNASFVKRVSYLTQRSGPDGHREGGERNPRRCWVAGCRDHGEIHLDKRALISLVLLWCAISHQGARPQTPAEFRPVCLAYRPNALRGLRDIVKR